MAVGQQELQLKVLWLKNVLGLAIDQKVTKHRYPVTQYYFWPRTEAWDQLKLELDSKGWLPEKEKVLILNLATDVITHWRTNRNTDSIDTVQNQFKEAVFVDLNA
jgi:30S ribosomal protein 3